MFQQFLLVAAGGAAGSMLRYAIGQYGGKLWNISFPLATLGINTLGSFVIGVLAGWIAAHPGDSTIENIRPLLMAGLCGGFTTFSAFSLESFDLIKNGQGMLAFAYIAVSVLLCLGATALGYMLVSGSR